MTEVPDNVREAFERQTEINFAALGRYVQAFEQVCWQLRTGIVFSLREAGLRKQQLSQIIVSQYTMTALPLLDLASAMLREMYGSDAKAMEVLRQLYKGFKDEIEHRNDWLHSSWFIGWGNLEKGIVADLAQRAKLSPKKGVVTKTLKEERDLRSRAEKLEEIYWGFGRLFACLHFGYAVENNFWIIGGRYVSPDFARKQRWEDEAPKRSRS